MVLREKRSSRMNLACIGATLFSIVRLLFDFLRTSPLIHTLQARAHVPKGSTPPLLSPRSSLSLLLISSAVDVWYLFVRCTGVKWAPNLKRRKDLNLLKCTCLCMSCRRSLLWGEERYHDAQYIKQKPDTPLSSSHISCLLS